MDFSQYGQPSKEWLSFVATHPQAARDGFTGNKPAAAQALRIDSNRLRAEASASSIRSQGLDKLIDITTVLVSSKSLHEIPLRVYKTRATQPSGAQSTILYFHGGGYLLGDERTDDFLCCRMALETRATIISVIYRHTHKHKHPSQIDDAWEAFKYVRDNGKSLKINISEGVVVMGISAGCTLAAGVTLLDLEQSREQPGLSSVITGCVLGMPWLIHIDNYPFHLFASREVSAKIQNKETAVIPSARLQLFSDLLDAQDPTERLLNIPLLTDDELSGWPKTAILVAGADPLRDDGLIFAKRLQDLDILTQVHIYPGLPHGFRRWTQLEATRSFDAHIMSGLLWALDNRVQSKKRGSEWQTHEF